MAPLRKRLGALTELYQQCVPLLGAFELTSCRRTRISETVQGEKHRRPRTRSDPVAVPWFCYVYGKCKDGGENRALRFKKCYSGIDGENNGYLLRT